jgi:leucyl-tRNA synthetase
MEEEQKIDFAKIEKKWQDKWEKKKIFEANEDSEKKKYYILEMFPYPSATGLHMGHAFNFTIGDVFSRFKKMQGFNVLHPVGFDSLGLPAENAAIKVGKHPEEYTNNSIKNFVKQEKKLGITYAWDREINTADPNYYKWDQWIFLKMFEKGLVYEKEAPVNWCSSCNTIISNEQAQGGKCDRCGTEIEIKKMKQWFLKITDYADRLLEGHKKLDWPAKTIAMQKNWIGKSYGTEIDFEIEDKNISNVVIVHGSPVNKEETKTYSQHWMPWIKEQLKEKKTKIFLPLMPEPWEPDYNKWKKEFSKLEIDENSILVGHSSGTTFLVRWLGETRKKIKKLILVAPWKVAWEESKSSKNFCDYEIDSKIKNNIGEIIYFTSDDEEKDGKDSVEVFHKKLGGKIIELSKHGHFTLEDMKTEKFPELLAEINSNKKWPIFTTRPDTIFGVTFMVVSAQHTRLNELVTKEQKSGVEKFLKKLKSVSEKELADMEKEGVFTGSYAINPANGDKVPVYAGNFVVADYGAGMVMAVPAHDQRDFEFAKKYKIPIKQVIEEKIPTEEDCLSSPDGSFCLEPDLENAYTGEGTLYNSGDFNYMKNEEAKKEITGWLISKKLARKVVNYKLRDWSVARQRYWGTPIPLIHCEKCGVVPVKEKDLPVKLPKEVKFGEGNPLLTNKEWLNVKCPKCNGKARREANTMDTFVNSSWYFLRYCDSKNNNEIFSKDKVKYWMPVDLYIGGAEHACMHLIYSRFYTMFLHDLGLIDFEEFAPRLFHQGMINDEKGEKMSKSKGNVIEPLETIAKYGVDATRFYLLSEASPDKGFNWTDSGIQGATRIINKIWKVGQEVKIGKDSNELKEKINKTIKNITEQIEKIDYRKSTIELRELFDLISKESEVSKETLEKSLKLLAPFCPHIAEEIWEKLGNKEFISIAEWPKYEEVKKSAKQEDINEKIIGNVKPTIDKILSTQKVEKVYLYVMPFEIKQVSVEKIEKALGKPTKIFAVNDSNKYDPENKAKKALPGKPSIFVK